MQLTVYSDYSLRVLIYLALVGSGTTTISEIAERYGISRNHLVKVAHNLGKLGYLETTRGRTGGVRLAMEQQEICLGKVVRDVEPNFALVECFTPEKSSCPIQEVCGLRAVLREAQEAFFEVLDRYTLSDLVANRNALQAELGLRLL